MLDYIPEVEIKVVDNDSVERPDVFIKRTGKDGGAVIGYLDKNGEFVEHHDFKDGDELIDTSKDTAGNSFTYSVLEGKWVARPENVKAKSNARPMVMNADGTSLVTDVKYSKMLPHERNEFNSRD